MHRPILLLLPLLVLPLVDAGCFELRLCCAGRNTSCVALDTGHHPPRGNAVPQPDRGRTPATAGPNSWHLHLDGETDLNSVTLDMGDRFFRSLLHDRAQNLRLHDGHPLAFDLDEGSGAQTRMRTSAEQEGSGEQLDGVEWLSSKEMTPEVEPTVADPLGDSATTTVATGTSTASDDQQQQLVHSDHRGGIKYVITSDSLPMAVDNIELMQNYHSIGAGHERACYCDEACRELNDCCGDYESFCPVTDCQVDEWSPWSHCEADRSRELPDGERCGKQGTSRRSRRVVRHPAHGGNRCPILEQQRACFVDGDSSCTPYTNSEVSLILAYEFGNAREPGYRNTTDIFYDLPKDLARWNRLKSYCVIFESVWLNPACQSEYFRSMQSGRRLCLECQPAAQIDADSTTVRCRGEGVEGRQSIWNLVTDSHCHGYWIRQSIKKSDQTDCSCPIDYPDHQQFLLV